MKALHVLAAIGIASLATAASAQNWNEIIDAPFCPHPTGQPTVGVGALLTISGFGEFTPGTSTYDADLYCVHIDGQFTASTIGGATWDTMLALYTPNCTTQLAFNDDTGGLQSFISGTVAPGDYILAISRFSNFAFDGPGNGANPYRIDLTGMSYCQVPAPGAAALLGLGGLVAVRRRR
ncbi:MAG: DVUA0089 family protein [Phycisphaerales bacterium]